MGEQLIKFRHNDKVGIFHYTIIDGDFVVLSEKNTSKIDYIKERGALDVTFDMDSTIYDVMAVDVIEDVDYVQKVYDYMQETNNAYFNDGPEGLVALRFHK